MDARIRWQVAAFDALDLRTLYAVLALRAEVFVVEQDCPYQDVDGRDLDAMHLLGWHDDALVAYLRVIPAREGSDVTIGRVVTSPLVRGTGLGRPLMRRGLDVVRATHGPVAVFVSAQAHLAPFYGSLGFAVCGEGYLEDGIPHLPMRRPADGEGNPAVAVP